MIRENRRRPAVLTAVAGLVVVVALWVVIGSPLVLGVTVALAAGCAALVASGRERSAGGVIALAAGLICLAVAIAYGAAIGLCQADVYCLFN